MHVLRTKNRTDTYFLYKEALNPHAIQLSGDLTN